MARVTRQKTPGRPKPTYRRRTIAKVQELAGRGLTMQQIAECMGIGRSTLFEHKARFLDLSDAIKRGRSKGIAEISNALFEAAKEGNVTAQIFYLKNRDPENWRDVSNLKIEERRELERFTREDVVRVAKNVLKQAAAEAADPMNSTIDDEVLGNA